MIALLNLSVLGFSFVVVFHDKAKRTQQEDLLMVNYIVYYIAYRVKVRDSSKLRFGS